MKYLQKLIPKSIQGELLRRLVSTKNLGDLKNVTVKVAVTFEEFKKAAELLHDCYVGKGLMEAHASKMRCNVHSFLPHNTVIIAVNEEGRVVGTVSLIQDNPLGVPADSVYGEELKKIRSQENREIVEVSALSIAPEYRQQSHAIQFLLNRYLYIYSKHFLNVNTLVIVVHPNAELFYGALLKFKPVGKVISYDFVKGALARLMYMDFSGDFEEKIWILYGKRKNSLIDYILFQKDDRLIYKSVKADDVEMRNREIAIALMKVSQFDLLKLKRQELSYIISGLNLRRDDLIELGVSDSEVLFDYRFQKRIMARGQIDNRDYIFRIYNLSTRGAFVEVPLHFLDKNSTEGTITFQWRGQEFSSKFKIRWINEGASDKLPKGIGIEFLNQEINFFDEEIKYQRKKQPA